jgi:hypothetical protein
MLGIAFAETVFTTLVNGAQAFFSMIGQSIPDVHRDVALAAHSVLTKVEQATDVDHAVEGVTR